MEVEEKYYRVRADIDLDKVYKNVENIKKNIGDNCEIIAVIKADGYGHGAVPIAKTLSELVKGYAVATAEEAMNLREHGITKPIYILGFVHELHYENIIREELIPSIFDYETAKSLSKVAKRVNKKLQISIKIDTGMNRLGYKFNKENIEIVKKINELDNIEIITAFTHFAKSDEIDKAHSYKQLEEFDKFINELEKMNIKIPIKHTSNSAAIIDIKDAHKEVVRAGIAIYGMYPSEEVDKKAVELYPVLELKSHIVMIKDIKKQEGVSYGHTFVANKPLKIATIPVGYGDGYPRNLSNKGYCLINGKKANIVGRVCMDYFMCDITNIMDAKLGDEVVLVGESQNERITVEELAKLAGTFNYEFVCNIGKRIPRVYYRKGKVTGMKDYFIDKYLTNY